MLLLHHPSSLDESVLVSLYNTRVHPALPLLPNLEEGTPPPCLQSAMLATSLSLSQSTRSLSALAWSLVEMGSPVEMGQTLADMAAVLLQLGARTGSTNRTGYMLLAKVSGLSVCVLLTHADDRSSSNIRSASKPSSVEYSGMGAGATHTPLGGSD